MEQKEQHSKKPNSTSRKELERLCSFPETNPNPVIEVILEGEITYVNPAAETLFPDLPDQQRKHPLLNDLPSVRKDLQRDQTQSVIRTVEVKDDYYQEIISFDSDEEHLRIYAHNVTEQKELEGQLQQAQKMEAIGRLAGGIAHDFNNLLTVIGGYADLLHNQSEKPANIEQSARVISETVEKASKLTQQLLTFSRKQPVNRTAVQLREVISNLHSMLDRVLASDITLSTEYADHLDPVYADEGQIEQILMNLVVNASHAIEGGGAITIRVTQISLENPKMQNMVKLDPGDYAIIYVSDTGVGMDEETKSHIFEPFFTTKEEGEGTGLGLSTVYGIIQQHQGEIKVDSVPGKGTTFQIYLPIADTLDHDHKDDAPEVESLSEAAASILVVEDDENILRYLEDMLSGNGYQVQVASQGKEALEKLSESPDYDVVLTDIIMPGMNGGELAHEIHKQFPDLPVIFMSGHAAESNRSEIPLRTGENFLQKPFKFQDLLRLIQQHIAKSQASH